MQEQFIVYKIDFNTGLRISFETIKDSHNECLEWIKQQNKNENYEIVTIYNK